jgi:hypothetical protein
VLEALIGAKPAAGADVGRGCGWDKTAAGDSLLRFLVDAFSAAAPTAAAPAPAAAFNADCSYSLGSWVRASATAMDCFKSLMQTIKKEKQQHAQHAKRREGDTCLMGRCVSLALCSALVNSFHAISLL